MIRRFVILLSLASCVVLSACSTSRNSSLQHEDFGETGVFTRSFPGTEQAACEAARRALLSQGYVISDWQTAVIKGRRKYQHDADVHSEIEFNVVCVADSKGSNSTTVFANAIRDRYSLKKSNNSASIGVSAIGSVSLPFGSSDDALVKVASETIPTGQFYNQFYELLERYLDSTKYPNENEGKDEPAALTPAVVAPAPAAPEASTPEPSASLRKSGPSDKRN